MDSFYYSEDARDIVHLFYQADVMVYVEGEDDVPFWEFLFDSLVKYKVEVQDVGGSKELLKYIDDINDGKLQGLIACDSDFEVLKNDLSNSNIIKTYGYSIENTLICESTILKVVKSIGKLSVKNTPNQKLKEWFRLFNNSIEQLILYDIYNEINELGISVVGDNCSRFFKSKNTYEICEFKIDEFIKNISFSVYDNEYDSIRALINGVSRNSTDFIRGHFLFSAVSRFISVTIKQINSKVSISNDALFGAFLLAFENSFDPQHKHYKYYEKAKTA